MAQGLTYKLQCGCALVALSAGIALYANDASAAKNATASVRDDYARIMFDWGKEVRFSTSRKGNNLILQFGEPNRASLGAVKARLSQYASTISQSADGKTITIALKGDYKTRNFVSGNKTGVDIVFGNVPRPETKVTSTQSIAPAPKKAAPEPIVITEVRKPVAPAAKAAPKAPEKTQLAPPVKTAEKAPVKAAEKPAAKAPTSLLTTKTATNEKPAPQKVADAKKVVMPKLKPEPAEAPKKDAVVAELNNAETEQATEKKADPIADIINSAKSEKKTEITKLKDKKVTSEEMVETTSIGAPGNNKDMLVTLKKTTLNTRFFFNFDERTAVSTFERGADVYLVFSTPRTIDTKRLNSVTPDYIRNVEQVPSSSGTVLRFTKSSDMSMVARKTGKGYEWVIDASRRPVFPKDVIIPKIVTENTRKPHIFIDSAQTSAPIEFRHAVSGEMITTIPMYQPSVGTYPERITQDATVLRTSQGIAFIPHQPTVKSAQLRSGIRIANADNATLSLNLAELDEANLVQRELTAQTFFPFESWKAKDISDFHAKEKIFLQDIVKADNKQANRLRLDLAKLYMAEGMYYEAMGLFNIIKDNDKDFYKVYQVSALDGMAHFMAGRFSQAGQLFADDVLQEEDEIAQWKRLVELMQGTNRTFPYFAFRKQYARFYSPDMQRHVATLAADHALSNKRYNTVEKIIAQLREDKLLEQIEDHTEYMRGRMAAEKGELEVAEKLLTPIIENEDNRFLRARATYTLATSKYKAGLLDRTALIEELEPLRTVWRGDGFELNLLNLLGELYVNNDEYVEGLRAWREAVSYFPDTAIAQDASSRMAKTFVELFNNGKADDLEPLTALSLYYEFRELTPLGDAGDAMIQNLADRLAQVDLLDKAASLLEHQVTFRLEKEERSRIGAQLALLYLLNREPEKTLNVLELTGYGDNSDELMQKRNHLAALGYAKTGQWQKALNLLEDDYSDAAKYIRMDIHWDNKDWDNVAGIAEDILASREDLTANLDEDQTRALLQLAVAYSFMGDADQLQYLKDYFPPLIADKNKQQSFAVITSAIDPVDREGIERLSAEMSKLETSLDGYRTTLNEKKLSMSF